MSTSYNNALARRRTVLVAVLNNEADLQRADEEGWYRIPQRRAPRRIAADFLAFYQTGAFGEQPQACTVTYYATTRRYHLLTRRELLPQAEHHPRADDYYYRIDIGPLQKLACPIPSATLRRITFIHTTLERLTSAGDVRDLYVRDDPFERLWLTLREHGLRPLRNRIIEGYPVDITLRARGGYLGIRCKYDLGPKENANPLPPTRWEFLSFTPGQLVSDLDGCLQHIGAALIELGGSDLRQRNPENG